MTRLLSLFAALALAACGPAEIQRAEAPQAPAPSTPIADVPATNAPQPPPFPPRESPDAPRAELVPMAFRGEWNADLARCGADLGEMRLTLTGDRIGFYESGGPIIDVVQEDALTVLLRARLSGEGQTWQRRIRLRLSEDGRTLTDISREAPVVRHRCPGTP